MELGFLNCNLAETKQFFIKDHFKRLVTDSMDTAVVNSATEKIIAWDDKRFTEEVLEPKNKLVKPMQLSCNKVASDNGNISLLILLWEALFFRGK